MNQSLRSQKQELVRNLIYDAGVELFATKGFDETTIEEIAQAAGVSRRTYFRYFETKDDLLAQNQVAFGTVLAKAVESCPRNLPGFEVIRRAVNAGLEHNHQHEVQTRKGISVAVRSVSARQAYLSRVMEMEDAVAAAFATRTRGASTNDMEPRLLAGVTLAIVNAATLRWFTGKRTDISSIEAEVFRMLMSTFCEPNSIAAHDVNKQARNSESSRPIKNAGTLGRGEPSKPRSR